MRWLIVPPFDRPGLMGPDFADELRTLGHEVRVFPYLRPRLDHYLRHPDEARAIGRARRRALAEPTLRHRLDENLTLLDARFGRR